jgi:hypothetical protein
MCSPKSVIPTPTVVPELSNAEVCVSNTASIGSTYLINFRRQSPSHTTSTVSLPENKHHDFAIQINNWSRPSLSGPCVSSFFIPSVFGLIAENILRRQMLLCTRTFCPALYEHCVTILNYISKPRHICFCFTPSGHFHRNSRRCPRCLPGTGPWHPRITTHTMARLGWQD